MTRPGARLLPLAVALVAAAAASSQDEVERARHEQAELQALVARCSAAYCAIGGGSGVCIRPDGLIVTNNHVAGRRERWVVFFGDGRPPLWARRLGVDERGDVCLLQVEGDHADLPAIPLGDASRLEVGEQVLALGNPWVLSQDGRPTVTFGVVSALHFHQGGYTDAIVTDAPVNPGNSGGPLINMRGEVVGINGQIAMRFQHPATRFNTGLGFAIPATQIAHFMKRLAGEDAIWHGTLRDVSVVPSANPRGVRVANLYRSGPSHASGLRYDDVITHVNGVPVTTDRRFWGLLATYEAGSRVTLSVRREQQKLTVVVGLASAEAVEHGILLKTARVGEAAREPLVPPVEPPAATGPEIIFTPEVWRVEEGSPAEAAGVKPGDVITHLDGAAVRTGAQFRRWITYHYPGQTVHLAVRRGDRSRLLSLTLSGRRESR